MQQNLALNETAIIGTITELHNQIVGLGRKSLSLAIELGGILVAQKHRLQHGQWNPWVQTNLPFGRRTATNYMQLYRFRDVLKSENVSGLAGAYQLLTTGGAMSFDEAVAAAAEIREDLDQLEDKMTRVVAAIARFRAIRDHRAYEPEFSSFEEYLASLGCSLEWFDAHERLCNAFTAWREGGSAAALLEAFRDVAWNAANGHNHDERSS